LCNVFGNQYLLDEKYLYEGEIVLYNVYFMKTGKKEDFNFMKVNLNAEVLIFSPSKGNFEGFKNCYSIPSEEIKSRIVVIKDYVINEKLNKNI